MDFVAIDVETANPDRSSICQIGIAGFEGGQLAHEWCTYVDPEEKFSPGNIAKHGIDGDTIAGAPTLRDLVTSLVTRLQGNIVVSHSDFDRQALQQAFVVRGLRLPELTWLDSSQVARRAWDQCRHGGYGLAHVCRMINYHFAHHDALEDAKAAGHVLLAAIETTGVSAEEWLVRVGEAVEGRAHSGQPRRRRYEQTTARDGNPDGPLYGQVILFTGTLSMPREDAEACAAEAGCRVAPGISKKVTLLVVGDQDLRDLAPGQTKSTKHRKAEELIAAGYPLRILAETDFMALVRPKG